MLKEWAERRGWLYYLYMDSRYTVDLPKNYKRIYQAAFPNASSDIDLINSGYEEGEAELSHIGRVPKEAIIGASPRERYDIIIFNENFDRNLNNLNELPELLKPLKQPMKHLWKPYL